MLSFANSQMNRASVRFGPSKLMLLPIRMLRPFEFQLDLAAQTQFGVQNKEIKRATKMEQTIAKASRQAERAAWKLRMKSKQLSKPSEADERGSAGAW